MLKEMLYNTSLQKVLYFLLAHPDKKYYDREISRLAKVSRAATNFSLRDLIKAKLVQREKRGRMYFYYVDPENSLIKQLKITQNLIDIMPLVDKLKHFSLKIVLYGSASKGNNHAESDIDLFILTREVKKVKDIIHVCSLKEKLQYVVNSPQDYNRLKKDNTVFCKEVSNGIILHEEK